MRRARFPKVTSLDVVRASSRSWRKGVRDGVKLAIAALDAQGIEGGAWFVREALTELEQDWKATAAQMAETRRRARRRTGSPPKG